MTFDELMEKVLALFPLAVVSEDLSGELTISTGLHEYESGTVGPLLHLIETER